MMDTRKPLGDSPQPQPSPLSTGSPKSPQKPASQGEINPDELRDEFIRHAQPVADALRKSGQTVEATQLEDAARIIGYSVGTPPAQQQPLGNSLQGAPVSEVLKNIYLAIEQNPALKNMPEAQSLRRAGEKLDKAGLLSITVRNGVVVSFVSNFADNFSRAQKTDTARPTKASEGPQSRLVPPPARDSPTGTTSPAPAAMVPSETPKSASPAPALSHPAPPTKQATRIAQGKGFTLADLPLEQLAKMGVTVERLQQSGQLQKLLAGEKTDLIQGLVIRTGQGEQVPFASKLFLHREALGGTPKLRFDLPKHQLEIPEQVMGKELTPAMRQELQTRGRLPLMEGFTDGQGQPFTAYLAVDKDLNRVVAVRREAIALPQELLGVLLSPEQLRQLAEGRPATVQGMRNSKNQLFDATVQLDPVKRQLTFADARPSQAPRIEQQPEVAPAPRPRIRL
ncbi:topoisomerase C-terminal repeat-containing protein [Hymenobacter tenuis]